MKKRRLKHKGLNMRWLMIIFLISLCITSVGYSLLSENLQLKGTVTLVKQINPEIDADFSYTKNVWGSNPYTIQFDVAIKNQSVEIKNGWLIYIDVPSDTEVVSCWSVKCSIQNGKLVLENVDYNSNIGIDGQFSFGVQLNTTDSNLELENPYFESKKEEEDEPIVSDDLIFTHTQTNSWQDDSGIHIAYDAIVQNNSINTLESWRVELAKEGSIQLESAWNANYIEQDDCIIFSNVSYNGTLQPQTSATFGFIILLDKNMNSVNNSLKLRDLSATR